MVVSKSKRPTIRDVAREAGVSYQTVSRVLNNQPKVSKATRERVLHTMDRLGYERNVAAQMLTTRRSQTIQVIVPDNRFPLELHTIARPAKQAGYLSLYSECTLENLAQTFNMAASRLVDGIILYAPTLLISDSDLVAISHNLPLVRRDYVLASKLTWVAFDQHKAAQMITRHLIELGHRVIAEVTGSMDYINPQARHESFIATLEAHDLTPGPCVEGDYSTIRTAMRTGYEGTRHLIETGAPFTALVLGNDYMAMGALRALHEARLRVPQDVSVASFDNAPHAEYIEPSLTTVEFDFTIQDRLACEHLFQRIKNPDMDHVQRLIPPELIIRDSTAPPSR